MKKTLVTLALILMGFMAKSLAMPISEIRTNARFLSDRMAYELELNPMQYEDCYEINYDFIYSINDLMSDVIFGADYALSEYYRLLDYRNEDLRYVLNATQYARFLALDYFYRPIYRHGRSWAFRIHSIYHNHSFYYFGLPSIYHSYHGAHSHHHYHNDYYGSRHHHMIHREPAHIHGTPHFQEHGRRDFGGRGNIDRPRNERHDRPRNDRPGNSHADRPANNHRSDGTRPQRGESSSRESHGNTRSGGSHGNGGTRNGGNHGGGNHGGGERGSHSGHRR